MDQSRQIIEAHEQRRPPSEPAANCPRTQNFRAEEAEITVDNIEVAEFVYLMVHNKKVRDVIDTITSKVVLILGRFTDERKPVLDAMREGLRKRNYVQILFDFDVPAARDFTETISLLARMARFVLADITDAKSVPQEVNVIDRVPSDGVAR